MAEDDMDSLLAALVAVEKRETADVRVRWKIPGNSP